MPIPSRGLVPVACLVAGVLLGCRGTQSQPNEIAPYEIVEIVPGVYAALANIGGSGVGNAGIINMGGSAIVYDTGLTPEAGRQLKEAAERLTENQIRFVINSHYHDDHVGGNQVFEGSSFFSTSATQQGVVAAGSRRSAESVAAAQDQLSRVEDRLAEESDPKAKRELSLLAGHLRGIVDSKGELERQAPTVVYDTRLNFSGSIRRVKVVPTGTGHAEGDAALWLEADSVLFAGGLVTTDRHPELADGDLDGWITALDTLLTLGFDVVVPGHGPVGDRQSVVTMQEYLRAIDRAAQQALDGTPLESIPVDSAFSEWMLEVRFRENVRFVKEKRRQ
ncbi:MAG TPA: MBL fold metallo-hydrolase [Rhodothermales bacterium]|nr:MBL fold metallo-hydrolase [Rhodothermales bacterium]